MVERIVKGKKVQIGVEYTGYSKSTLCSGDLAIMIDGKRWEFVSGSLFSGGKCDVEKEEEIIEKGKWSIVNWPVGFPKEYRKAVLSAVNKEIPHGCCGGCI